MSETSAEVKAAIKKVAPYLALLELIENNDFCIIISPEGIKIGDKQFKKMVVTITNEDLKQEQFLKLVQPVLDAMNVAIAKSSKIIAKAISVDKIEQIKF